MWLLDHILKIKFSTWIKYFTILMFIKDRKGVDFMGEMLFLSYFYDNSINTLLA